MGEGVGEGERVWVHTEEGAATKECMPLAKPA